MGRFRFLTAGESHGKGLMAIVEGMVADLPLEERYINRELKRRQQGHGRGPRMKIEEDRAEIMAGVRYGLTIGSPIALFITNRDWQNWQQELSVSPVEKEVEPVTCPRPGHADLAGVTKYGLEDIAIRSYTVAIGRHHWEPPKVSSINWGKVEASPVRCGNAKVEKAMVAAIDEAKGNGDTLGGIFEVIANSVPVGLGSHVSWDRRLDGKIARAIMSINAVKGVEIGAGFSLAELKGSQAHDVIEPSSRDKTGGLPWRHTTNRAGGIEGGISNGEDIIIRAAVKPIATLASPLHSIDLRSGEKDKAHYERSDICVVPAAGVIAEAMLAIVLADACLDKFGGDNLEETLTNYRNYLSNIS
jgi:chorismate synthase